MKLSTIKTLEENGIDKEERRELLEAIYTVIHRDVKFDIIFFRTELERLVNNDIVETFEKLNKEEWLENIDFNYALTNFDLELSELDTLDDALDSHFDDQRDSGLFDVEVIYYANAMKILSENDPSLSESIEIALEFGYELDNINSELLASLLCSRGASEAFHLPTDEIDAIIEKYQPAVDALLTLEECF